MRRKVLVVQPLHPDAIAVLDGRDDIDYTVLTDFSEGNLLDHIADVDAITIRDAPLPASVVEAAGRLRIVSRHGVGYDNIPIDVCSERGVPVTLVGAANAVSVAEHTMMLMLAAARTAIALDTAVRHGDFGVRSRMLGVELRGRTLVIVGYGRIGREVAARAAAFGMKVRVFDPYLTAAPEGVAVIADLDQALAVADVLTLHVPLTDETRSMVGARELALMPRGSILVNASRGGLVDETALLDAIRSGHLHAAGLDTFAVEPLPADSPLAAEPRIVLSPHSAALTEEALRAMSMITVQNALAGVDGELDPALVVNRSVLATSNGTDRHMHNEQKE